MAATPPPSIHTNKHKKLAVEHNQQDPNNFYYHFLYKAALVLIFFVILPLFPSQPPELINQSLLTRNWELLHILFVGIAISYGLFSRRNDETEKENTKFDNAQSLVSRFLQVSSFFEDESETPSEIDETKIQTWSNQHYRNEPVVVVAPKGHDSVFEEQSIRKPLLLPVRSLKSRLSDEQSVDDSESLKRSFSIDNSTSKTGSNRFSINDGTKMGEKMKQNAVLPSPIPWRSRSGRMESKQEVETPKASSTKESEMGTKVESPSLKSQSSRSSRAGSLSPSNSFSSESLAKNAEDLNLTRKKGFYKSCPPPPPPPPPMIFQKSISMKTPRYGSFNEGASFDKERSFTSETIGMKWNRKSEVKGKSSMLEGNKKGNEELTNSFRSDKFMHSPVVSEPASMEFSGEGEKAKVNFLDKMVVESYDDDEETETEDEDVGEERIVQKESEDSSIVEESSKKYENCSNNIGDEGPDVDKKADEFIAKFREQIRLQRIESIKRSTRTRNSSR